MYYYILLLIALALFSLALIIVIIYNFPWITRLWRLRVHHLKLFEDDLPIVIVSDIHLGSENSLGKQSLRIISRHNFRSLVIAGDLIDEKTLFCDEIFDLLKKFLVGSIKNVFYIPSMSSHDVWPTPNNPIVKQFNGGRIAVVPHVLVLSIDRCMGSLYITHGDYASRNGIIAHILDLFALKLFSKPFTGTVIRKVIRVGNTDWIIYGHSHLALYSQQLRIVNTGCWVKRPHESMQRAFAVATCKNGLIEIKFFRF